MFLGHTIETWIIFHLIVFFLLVLDLGVLNRKAHVINIKEALGWSVFWIAIGVSYGAYVAWRDGATAGTEYLTGYVVEKSLSVDNLFVFLVIFKAFQIPRIHQHRLLFWGILGAIVLRGIMIALGTQLLNQFHWVIYVFGAFLIWTGWKMFRGGMDEMNPLDGTVFRVLKKFLPFSEKPYDGHFIVKEGGKKKLSIGFAALMVIESSDVLFAVDSVPAVFGVTRDPYIVYTSNIFAILGLRSLYFVLEDMLHRFHLLKYGLSVILVLVGVKMCMEPIYKVPPVWSLAMILSILATSIVLSLKRTAKKH